MQNKVIGAAGLLAAAYLLQKMTRDAGANSTGGADEYRPGEHVKSMAGCDPSQLLAMGLNHSRLMTLITVRGMMS